MKMSTVLATFSAHISQLGAQSQIELGHYRTHSLDTDMFIMLGKEKEM